MLKDRIYIKTLYINCCALDSNSIDGRQALHPNSENTPKLLHYFLYRTWDPF